ncbi:MAG: hypothetical protein IKF11_04975, partial [Methanobrevibacter sp.]|nr:hypothetical protein [Methanobrevibacter sp.]
MKLNKIFFILIVLISILMLSSVSAKDINATNDNVISDSNDNVLDNQVLSNFNNKENSKNQTLSSSIDGDVLGADSTGSFSELDTLIKSSQVGDTVVLTKDFAYNSRSDSINGITISKTITINGNGHSIDGKSVARAFTVNANNVILKNLVIKSTISSTAGGAIAWNGEYGELINTTIQNSNATWTASSYNRPGGGAVYWAGSNGVVKNSKFFNCYSVSNGGTIAVDASNFRLIGSSFESGTGYRGGGVWFSRLATNSSITYSNFTKCKATDSDTNYGCGAVFYQLVMGYIDHCRFVENWGRAAGAVVWSITTAGKIYNSYFESNYGYANGAVVNYDGEIVNCTFVKNIGGTDACALKVGYTLVENCNFSQNYFNISGSTQRSLMYVAGAGASVLNCNFNNNNLPNNLVFIASAINYVSFERCNITGNTLNNVFYATTGNKYSFKNMRIRSNTLNNVVFCFNDQ